MQDSHLINTKHCHNHEESKTKFNKTTIKQKKNNKWSVGVPSTLHDDQMSFTLAFSADPKYHNSSSIRLLLHLDLYLGLVHMEKELTHFQVIVLPTSHEKHLYISVVLLHTSICILCLMFFHSNDVYVCIFHLMFSFFHSNNSMSTCINITI